MGVPTTGINLNKTTPTAPSGKQNVVFQSDNGTPQQSVTAYDPPVVGDTGTGGLAGNVPAPPAGAAAANKFLHADGSFELIPRGLDVMINDGSVNTDVALIPPSRYAFNATKVVVRVKNADTVVGFSFKLKQNNVDVLTSDPTIATSTAGQLFTYTNLISTPLTVSIGDQFSVDITNGSSKWQVTIQLE